MAEFETKCPYCGAPLSGQDEWIGMSVECPQCKQEFALQAPEAEAPATKLCPFCGNEINAKALRCKFCKKDLPQTGKQQPAENRPSAPTRQDAPAAPSRKKWRIVILAAGAFILFSAVIFFLICSFKVSFAMADAERLMSDPDNCPTWSALANARVRLDNIGIKYWFVFARSRTEDLGFRLGNAQTVVSAISEGEIVLRDREYGKFRETADQLKQVSEKYPLASAKRKIEDLIKRLNALIPSRQAIKELKVNDTAATPQITITKTINPGNDCQLYILPTDRKAEVAAIFGKMLNIGRNFRQYRQHLEEAKRLNNQASNVQITGISSYNTSTDIRTRAMDQIRQAKQSLQQAKACHDEVKAWLLQEALQQMKDLSNLAINRKMVNLASNSCTLSNVRGPVILLVWETINFGDGFSSFQGWYKEYGPSDAETWTLN